MINLINNYLFVVLPCSWYCILHKKQFGNSKICSFVMKYKAWILLASLLPDCQSIRNARKNPSHFPSIFYFDFTICTSLTVNMESCDSHILTDKTPNLMHYDQVLYPIVLPSENSLSNIQGLLTIHSPECM